MRYKYEVDIPIMFIVGMVFTIWGLFLCVRGIENRQNLKDIHGEEVNIMHVKEGEYIAVDRFELLGSERNGIFSPVAMVYISPADNYYYLIKLNPDTNDYISILFEPEYRFIEEYIRQSENICDFNIKPIEWDKDEPFEFAAKVVKIDENHESVIQDAKERGESIVGEWSVNKRMALVAVDLKEERMVLIWGLSVLAAGLIFLVGAKPWKMVSKRELPPEREFNLVYKEEVDHNDMRFLEETARELRMAVRYYEDDYKKMKKKVIKNLLAFIVSILAFNWIKISITLLLLCIFCLKWLFSVCVLVFNMDTAFSASCLSAFHKEPVKRILCDKKEKLEKCDRIIRESLMKKEEEDCNYETEISNQWR